MSLLFVGEVGCWHIEKENQNNKDTKENDNTKEHGGKKYKQMDKVVSQSQLYLFLEGLGSASQFP